MRIHVYEICMRVYTYIYIHTQLYNMVVCQHGYPQAGNADFGKPLDLGGKLDSLEDP